MKSNIITYYLIFFSINISKYSSISCEVIDRHFYLHSSFYCQFSCQNATFANCVDTRSKDKFLIYIINNDIENYNFETSHFNELRKLGLANINGSFDSNFLKEFINLESLRIIGYPLFNNNVTVLPDLSSLHKLKSINLYNNNLGHLWNSEKLENDQHLKKRIDCNQLLPVSTDFLDLVANKISYLPNWISNLVNLAYINLNYNELEFIPYGLFRNMKLLKYVYLNMNNLKKIENFLPLTSLAYLDIKMQRSMERLEIKDFAFNIQNPGLDINSINDAEELVIDLRSKPEKINFRNKALCSKKAHSIERYQRRLLILNNSYNNCILKQFDGIIEIFNFDQGIFAPQTKTIDYRECKSNKYSYSNVCSSVWHCDERYNCENTKQEELDFIRTKPFSKKTKNNVIETNPFIDEIRARNTVISTTHSRRNSDFIKNSADVTTNFQSDVSIKATTTATSRIKTTRVSEQITLLNNSNILKLDSLLLYILLFIYSQFSLVN